MLRVRFWGVRGSHPTPGPRTVEVGGNTACVEVRAGPHLLILDAGTGIIGLGDELVRERRATGKPIVAHIFYTHTHHDHIQGFPFFKPAYLGDTICYMYGPGSLQLDLEGTLSSAMLPPTFPVQLHEMSALKLIHTVNETQVIVIPPSGEPMVRNAYRDAVRTGPEDVRVDVLRSYAHPHHGVLIYRITWRGYSLVYATDTEGYHGGDQRLIAFARAADLLIHDAQYTEEEYGAPQFPKQGWGHSTPEMAIGIARAAGIGRLVLFHHDPAHDDAHVRAMERAAQTLFPSCIAAYEGLTLTIPAVPPPEPAGYRSRSNRKRGKA